MAESKSRKKFNFLLLSVMAICSFYAPSFKAQRLKSGADASLKNFIPLFTELQNALRPVALSNALPISEVVRSKETPVFCCRC